MNASYGPSGSFVSILRSKSIGHDTYTGRSSNSCSKTTPIHGPVHKYDSNYSYSRSNFSRLPQVVGKGLINFLSHKVSYASVKIDPVVDGFSPNDVKKLHICDYSIVAFVIIGFCLGFSNTSHVDSLCWN